jgi:lipoate-protein ligase A
MKKWRFLAFEAHNAFMNMAIDEAILRSRLENKCPNTLRLYGWKPSAVSVGRFQKVENEVNMENCSKLSVDVVRRISGGGTVYHDTHREITYSVVARTADFETSDVAVVYTKVYSGIVEALKMLGITADFSEGDAKNCPNLTVRGKKISGSSQANKSGVVLQHGTLLLNVDLEKMFTLLRVRWAKTCMEIVNVAKNKITSIGAQKENEVSFETITQVLKQGFEKALKVEFVDSDLKPFEKDLASELCKLKYSTQHWNLYGESNLN